jgi:putative membrane-bound dehydrogenase-like protein
MIRHSRWPALVLAWLFIPVSWAQGPSAPPRPPREEQASFVLADPDLTIELVASEPEVASPVAIAWDEEGRLFVAEMLDYPTATTSGRIRMLEDRDGDGRYERATVFADGLPFPNGVLPCYGGVLVTAAPDIWFLRDKDGDGRAEERQIVLTGFGEGNTQLRVNGLTWGLDNWIYVANGRSDGAVRRPSDPPARAVSIRRRDLRLLLVPQFGVGGETVRAFQFEAIAGSSQFGLAHDDWGNRFPSWNTIPIRHVVLEQKMLDRNPFLAETSSIASILDLSDGGRIFPIGPPQPRFNRESVAFFNASCGPLIERGGLLPAPYQGNAFICEPLANLVHRRVLEPAGVTFIAHRAEQGREFLASTDPAFRPVNLANGPDGALYVVDMYRELVEHPEFVPERDRGSVDFRRWHHRGRIWRIRPKTSTTMANRRPNLGKADDRTLVALLGNRNAWWRTTAQRLLVGRGLSERLGRGREHASSRPLLLAVSNSSPNALARVHALWTLMEADPYAVTPGTLGRLAGDVDPRLREQALRMDAYKYGGRWLPTEALVRLADDPAIRVRLRAALALGDLCQDPAALRTLGRIAARDVSDPWMRLAILSGLAESASAFVPLCDKIAFSEGRSELLSQCAAIIGARKAASELVALVNTIADRARGERSADAMTLLAGLTNGLDRAATPLHVLIAAPPADLRAPLERLAPLWPIATATATSSCPVPERLAALDVLARGRPDLAEGIIPGLLAADQPREIQLTAVRAVARVGRTSLADKALDRWESLALATRRELLSALTASPALAEPLIRAMEREVIAPRELDVATRDGLRRLADPALRGRAASVLARFAPPERSAVIARYQPALKLAGDTVRGRTVFARNCQTCHQHRGQGHRAGPDLSGIAGRAPDQLLSDILDPNKNVEPDYIVLAVATRRGQVYSGLLAEETATTVKLRRAEGVEDTLLRSEIDELRSTGQSLMPEGLEQNIDPQEMADLIAFLRTGG